MSKPSNSNATALKAGGWYVFSNFLVKGVGIFTTPIITRMINPVEFGVYSTYRSLLLIMTILLSLNVVTSIAIARYDHDSEEEFNDYISSVVTLSSLAITVLFILLRIFIAFFGNPFAMPVPLIDFMYFNIMLVNVYDIMQTKHRSEMKYKQFVMYSLFVSLIAPLLSIFLINLQQTDKFYGYVLGTQLPIMLIALFLTYQLYRDGRQYFNRDYWKYSLSISVPLIPHSLSNNILSQSDRIIINYFKGAAQVGLYSLAYSYSAVLMTIWNALNQAWAPWFYGQMKEKNYQDIQRFVKPYTILFSILFLGMLMLGPEALKIFGPAEYQEGVWIIPPVLLGLYFQFTYSLYVNIEIYLKKTSFISVGTMIAAAVNIVLNLLIIPSFGFIGAAYTTLIGYVFLFAIHYFMANRMMDKQDVIGNDFIIKWSIFMVLAAVIFGFLTHYIVARMLVGMLIFGLIALIYRKQLAAMIEFITQQVKKRIKG